MRDPGAGLLLYLRWAGLVAALWGLWVRDPGAGLLLYLRWAGLVAALWGLWVRPVP